MPVSSPPGGDRHCRAGRCGPSALRFDDRAQLILPGKGWQTLRLWWGRENRRGSKAEAEAALASDTWEVPRVWGNCRGVNPSGALRCGGQSSAWELLREPGRETSSQRRKQRL